MLSICVYVMVSVRQARVYGHVTRFVGTWSRTGRVSAVFSVRWSSTRPSSLTHDAHSRGTCLPMISTLLRTSRAVCAITGAGSLPSPRSNSRPVSCLANRTLRRRLDCPCRRSSQLKLPVSHNSISR